jgi:hypothetical protein
MYVHARGARADRAAALAAGLGIGLLAAGTFAVITSQDPSPAFAADGLLAAGAVTATAGAAALGTSLWLSSQQRGAVVGIAGAF